MREKGRTSDRLVLGLIIIIVAIPLNVYGLRWGLPNESRNELYFSNDKEIRENRENIITPIINRLKPKFLIMNIIISKI